MFRFKKAITIAAFYKFFFVPLLVSVWIISGWPQVWDKPAFPPKIQEAQATPLSAYATSNSSDGSLAGWTNPTYAYTDDGVQFATRAGTAKNTWYGTLYGFNLAAIPDGAIINSVTITAEWKNSAADSSGPEFLVGAKSGGAEVGSGTTDTSGQLAFETTTYSPSGLTAAQLKATGASGFWAIMRFRRTDNTAHTASVDYIKIDIDYTPINAPTVTLSAAGSVEATTATLNGNVTATGGANPTVTMYWGDNDGGQVTGNWDNNSAPTSPAQPQGVAAFLKNATGLPSGTTIYFSAKGTNSGGTGWPAASLSFLTKPAAPTGVDASINLTDKVTINWAKSTGATNYRVYRDGVDISGLLGDVATYDDSTAAAPTITAGSAVATKGTFGDKVSLSLSGTSFNNGTSYTYKVVASNATGNSADSNTDPGYRAIGTPGYQWQRTDIDDGGGTYSDLTGANGATYDDTTAPDNGPGRYYRCNLSATGATPQTSGADRGFRSFISVTLDPGSGTVTYGYVETSKNTTGAENQTQTVRNNGNVAEDFDIKGQHSANWTLGTSAGDHTYSHEWCTATCDSTPVWNAMTTTYDGNFFGSNVGANTTKDFDLRITVPTSNAGGNQQQVNVTIQATQH